MIMHGVMRLDVIRILSYHVIRSLVIVGLNHL